MNDVVDFFGQVTGLLVGFAGGLILLALIDFHIIVNLVRLVLHNPLWSH